MPDWSTSFARKTSFSLFPPPAPRPVRRCLSNIPTLQNNKLKKNYSMRLLWYPESRSLIILDITKLNPNFFFFIPALNEKKCHDSKHPLANLDFTDGKPHKARELDMIILRNHAPRSYLHDYPWPWHDYCIISREMISKIHGTLSANQKRDSEFNV